MTKPSHLLAQRLGDYLSRCGASVTTAESCTGGGIAEAITSAPGASGWFNYGFVTYSNAAKQRLLNVPDDVLRLHGAVSAPVVCAMAEGAAREANAQFAVAVSGIAGPSGGSESKPVGTVWLAWLSPLGVCHEHQLFLGDRNAIREQTVERALDRLLELAEQYCTKTQ